MPTFILINDLPKAIQIYALSFQSRIFGLRNNFQTIVQTKACYSQSYASTDDYWQ